MVGFKYNVGTTIKEISTANDLLCDENIFNVVKHDREYEYDSLKYVIEHNIMREIDNEISNGMELDDEVSYFYKKVIDLYNKEDDGKERYTIRYYELNKIESEKYTLNFNSNGKAEEYISEYKNGNKDLEYSNIYTTYVLKKDNNDHEAYIYKYDYKV
jgi:hypothetical protein